MLNFLWILHPSALVTVARRFFHFNLLCWNAGNGVNFHRVWNDFDIFAFPFKDLACVRVLLFWAKSVTHWTAVFILSCAVLEVDSTLDFDFACFDYFVRQSLCCPSNSITRTRQLENQIHFCNWQSGKRWFYFCTGMWGCLSSSGCISAEREVATRVETSWESEILKLNCGWAHLTCKRSFCFARCHPRL